MSNSRSSPPDPRDRRSSQGAPPSSSRSQGSRNDNPPRSNDPSRSQGPRSQGPRNDNPPRSNDPPRSQGPRSQGPRNDNPPRSNDPPRSHGPPSNNPRSQEPRNDNPPRSHGHHRSASSAQAQASDSSGAHNQPPLGTNKPRSGSRPSLVRFMSLPVMEEAYDEINTRGSLESVVDGFWTTMLCMYFRAEKGFMVKPQSQPNQTTSQKKADLTVKASLSVGKVAQSGAKKRRVLADKMITVMIVESKRRGLETQSSVWRAAHDQLKEYLKKTFEKEQNRPSGEDGTIYGAIAVGTYVRFYYLPYPSSELHDAVIPGVSPKPNNQPWELKQDTEEIHQILQWLERKVTDVLQKHNKDELEVQVDDEDSD